MDHQKFVGGFALSGFHESGRASILPLSFVLWVIAVDTGHQSIKNCRIWIDQLDHLPAFMTTYFFGFSLSTFGTNYAQIFRIFSSHTDIKLCIYCLYRHTTVLIHKILSLANQLWWSDFLTPPTPLINPHRHTAFRESLMPLENWCSIHARWSKRSLKDFLRFCGLFSKIKTQFYCILFFWCVLTAR